MIRSMLMATVAAGLLIGCGGADTPADDRDLTLAPAESIATIGDLPDEGQPTAQATNQPAPSTEPRTPRRQPRTEPQAPRQAAPSNPSPAAPTRTRASLDAGTTFTAYGLDTLTSRHNKVGDPVAAVIAVPLHDANGVVVIPENSVITGRVVDVAPAESPGGQGRLVLEFTAVEIGGESYAISTAADSIATHMKGRGVTAGDAAKVGAGVVVGAIAGRIIGGNKTGTAVGAAAGAAAGVGIAAATRDIDILYDAGAPVYLRFLAAFVKP